MGGLRTLTRSYPGSRARLVYGLKDIVRKRGNRGEGASPWPHVRPRSRRNTPPHIRKTGKRITLSSSKDAFRECVTVICIRAFRYTRPDDQISEWRVETGASLRDYICLDRSESRFALTIRLLLGSRGRHEPNAEPLTGSARNPRNSSTSLSAFKRNRENLAAQKLFFGNQSKDVFR